MPTGGGVVAFVVIDMRRINNSVSAGGIRYRTHTNIIIGILLPADNADVVGALCPNRVQEGLEPRSVKPFIRCSTTEPNGPGIGKGLVE